MSRQPLAALVVAAAVAAQPAPARAADAEVVVTAEFDRNVVSTDDLVSYTITATGTSLSRAPRSPRPNFAHFKVVRGPTTGRSTQISFVGGRTTQSISYTFTWELAPLSAGTLAVPKTLLEIEGTVHGVPVARLKVSDDPVRTSRRDRHSRSDPWGTRRGARTPREPRIVVQATVDDDEVWLGQEVVLTHVLEYDVQVNTFSLAAPMEAPGFEKTPRKVEHASSPVRGQTHQRVPLSQWVLVPLADGDKELPPSEYTIDVAGSRRGVLDLFARGQRVSRTTQPLSIRVRPLPESAPESFSGAVGAFSLSAGFGPDGDRSVELKQGDGTTLVVKVSGSGNLRTARKPVIDLPLGLRSFAPEVEDIFGASPEGYTRGRKVFSFPILVTEAGQHEIPAVEWSFFDPRAGRYVTRRSKPLTVEAEAVTQPIDVVVPRQSTVARVEVDDDIRHVHASMEAGSASSSGRTSPWLWLAIAVGPLLNVAVVGLRVIRQRQPADELTIRGQRAARRARQRLREARSSFKAGRTAEAADAVARSVAGFVTDRLGEGEGERSPAEVEACITRQLGGDVGQRVRRLLADCDVLRFAAGAGGGAPDAGQLLREAEAVLRLLESLRRDDETSA